MGQKVSSGNAYHKEIRSKVIILSVFYLLVVVSFASFSNVVVYIHQKYRHKGYGEAYLTANSIASVFTYIFCPLYLSKTKINSSKLLILSGSGYFINMLIPAIFSIIESIQNQQGVILPPSTFRFICEILANTLGGIGSVIFWVLNGVYMASYCEPVPQNKKGRYFSISNAILSMRSVVGPVLTTVGLGLGNESIYFLLLTLMVLAALPMPICFIPSIKIFKNQQQQLSLSDSQTILQQHEQQSLKCNQIISHLNQFLKCFKEVSLLIPCCVVSGLMMGFVSSSLSHLLPWPTKGENNDTKISITLLFFGIGSIIGGYLSGNICDRFSLKIAGYFGNILIIISCLVQTFFLSTSRSLQGACVVGFLAGISFSFLFSYAGIVCTIHYKGTSYSFAVTKMINTVFYISYQWFVAIVNNMCNMRFNMIYQSLALIPIAIFACYCIKAQCSKHSKYMEQIGISIHHIDNKTQVQVQSRQN